MTSADSRPTAARRSRMPGAISAASASRAKGPSSACASKATVFFTAWSACWPPPWSASRRARPRRPTSGPASPARNRTCRASLRRPPVFISCGLPMPGPGRNRVELPPVAPLASLRACRARFTHHPRALASCSIHSPGANFRGRAAQARSLPQGSRVDRTGSRRHPGAATRPPATATPAGGRIRRTTPPADHAPATSLDPSTQTPSEVDARAAGHAESQSDPSTAPRDTPAGRGWAERRFCFAAGPRRFIRRDQAPAAPACTRSSSRTRVRGRGSRRAHRGREVRAGG